MGAMKKEEVHNILGNLNIDYSKMTWPEKLKLATKLSAKQNSTIVEKIDSFNSESFNNFTEEEQEKFEEIQQEHPTYTQEEIYQEFIKQHICGKEMYLSPHMIVNKSANEYANKYKEPLGHGDVKESVPPPSPDELIVRHAHDKNQALGVYSEIERYRLSNKELEADSTIPEINAEIRYRPDRDFVPRVIDRSQGVEGYILSSEFGGVRELFMDAGVWEQYKKRITDNSFLVNNKTKAVDIHVVHELIKELQYNEGKDPQVQQARELERIRKEQIREERIKKYGKL